jgi:hypothetical protein
MPRCNPFSLNGVNTPNQSSVMKRFTIIAIAVVVSATLFTACEKDATEKEPDVVICFFEPYIPIRVINTKGEDLLDPSKLPGGTLDIKWEIPGTSMPVTKMNPAVYSRTGQPDRYFVSAPLANADKGLSVYFTVKIGDTDTLFIRTATSSSKPYGLTEVSFNGIKIEPKMLFDTTVYGIEIVKGTTSGY